MNREDKIRTVIGNRQEGVVVLEDIHDPHNAAAIWRSCDAFGIQKIYLIFNKEEEFNPKKIGKASSSSANKWLTFEIFHSTKECFEKLKSEGYETWATVLDGEAKTIDKAKMDKRKIALVLGNEHRGLSEEAIKMADHKLYIPMKGMVQSFNLSVTAAICLYEISRQRKNNKLYSLDSSEKESLYNLFTLFRKKI